MRSVIKTILGTVVVLGLLVGFAHWRLAAQTPDGVWDYDLEAVRGSIHVAGDTVLVSGAPFGDGWVAVDRRSGKRLAGDNVVDVREARLGHNGWFAIDTGTGDNQALTVYNADGQQVWQHRHGALDQPRVMAFADDGVVVATVSDDGQQFQKVDGRGEVVWQRPASGDESAWVMHLGTTSDDEEIGEYVTTPSVPAVQTGDDVRLLDAGGRPVGPAGAEHQTVVVRDMLITSTVADGECHFRAWRGDGEEWASSTPCPGTTKPPFLDKTIGDVMYVSVGDVGRFAVDVTDGSVAEAPYRFSHGFNPETLKAVAFSGEVAVEQHKSTFTGWDPRTGKKVWSYDGPAPTKGLTSNKMDRYPGVDVSGDLVSILSTSKPWWRGFAWGSDVPSSTVTLLDGRDGEKFATYRSADLYSMTATDRGLLLLSDGKLRLIER